MDHSIPIKTGIRTSTIQAPRANLERPTSIEPAAEGGAVATVPYGSVRWLLSKVLSHRGEAEVLGPDWLREAVRDQAESLLTTAEPEPARG